VSQLARIVSEDRENAEIPLWDRPDGLKRFRQLVRTFTRRDWTPGDNERLFERVKRASERHYRKPVQYGDLLRLLWNKPHECAKCGRRPPIVVLHVDHIVPASRGGSSNFENLQFLCSECNLRKSDRLEEAELWLDSV
jgi:5-methylcytosine-specific restriction endonuclease McrA